MYGRRTNLAVERAIYKASVRIDRGFTSSSAVKLDLEASSQSDTRTVECGVP